jgi:hypothetical protein
MKKKKKGGDFFRGELFEDHLFIKDSFYFLFYVLKKYCIEVRIANVVFESVVTV